MSLDPFDTIATRQRTMMRNAITNQALVEGERVLREEGPEAATKVLAPFAAMLDRLAPKEKS